MNATNNGLDHPSIGIDVLPETVDRAIWPNAKAAGTFPMYDASPVIGGDLQWEWGDISSAILSEETAGP